MRRVTTILALCSALLGVGAFPAVAGGPNNVVQSSSSADPTTGVASTVVRSNVLTGSTGTNEVTSTNLASARAHDCTGCVAKAVAFQAVLVTGDPPTIAPRNVAAAVNENCDSCTAFAFAYQYVLTTSGPAHLSPAGLQRVHAFRQQVADLANDPTLDPFALRDDLHALEPEFQAIIDEEIVRTGGGATDRSADEKVDAPPPTPSAGADAPPPAPSAG